MGKRGPAPVDFERLRHNFESWALYLFTLRDGHDGKIQIFKWGRPEWRTLQKDVPRSEWALFREDLRGGIKRWFKWVPCRKIKVPVKGGHWKWETVGEIKQAFADRQNIVAHIIPVKKELRELPAELDRKFSSGKFAWLIDRPIEAKPTIWEQLKKAHSIKEMEQVARAMRAWASQQGVGIVYSRVVARHARDLLKAKRLPHYPGSGRKQSDDKRIQFFAKVSAGLTLGLAPATATQRLSNYRCPKDWAEKTWQDEQTLPRSFVPGPAAKWRAHWRGEELEMERGICGKALYMPPTKSFQQEKPK